VQLVAATVQLYNAIRTELLPTPNKSHYTFNLRDMGKVVQGLMRADPKTLSTQEQVCRALQFVFPEHLCMDGCAGNAVGPGGVACKCKNSAVLSPNCMLAAGAVSVAA
jgi:hypothetical protein